MLSLEDCLSLCELSEAEIATIVSIEKIPEVIAAGMARYLVHPPDGVPKLRRMILDDIAQAEEQGDAEVSERLIGVVKHFVATHPQLHELLERRS